MMSTMDEARKHVAEARRCHDKDISLGGCLSSMISAFEIVVETLIALPDARAVAEDVYAGKAKPPVRYEVVNVTDETDGLTISQEDRARLGLDADRHYPIVEFIPGGKARIAITGDAATLDDLCDELTTVAAENTENFERWMEAHGHDRMPPATFPTDTGAGEGLDVAKLIASGTELHERCKAQAATIADLEQRLAEAGKDYEALEAFEAGWKRRAEAAEASLEAMERRVGEAVEKLKWDLAHPEVMGHDRGEIIAVLTGEGPSPAALTPDAGEGR